nr:hypothetical protein CFP56_63373 [Quercus suber]POE94783.1 hypothetical protein CFP56_17020 [Quercus suber]
MTCTPSQATTLQFARAAPRWPPLASSYVHTRTRSCWRSETPRTPAGPSSSADREEPRSPTAGRTADACDEALRDGTWKSVPERGWRMPWIGCLYRNLLHLTILLHRECDSSRR